jgi:hypothetical protein
MKKYLKNRYNIYYFTAPLLLLAIQPEWRRIIRIIVILILAAYGYTVAPSGIVHGTVYFADGVTPIFMESGDGVWLYNSTSFVKTVTCNEGLYNLSFVPANPAYHLEIWNLTTKLGQSSNFALLPYENKTVDVSITYALGSVSGTIYYSDGVTPYPSVTVVIQDITAGYSNPYGWMTTTTDANGHYTFNTVSPIQRYQIGVESSASDYFWISSGESKVVDLQTSSMLRDQNTNPLT